MRDTMPMPRVLYDVVKFKGGWNQLTPTLDLPPGFLRDVQNFECEPTGGYTRIGGYERFDGQVAPSAATYTIVQITSFTNTPTLGQILTGNTSGATGQIIALGSNYLVLTLVSGTFTSTEVVKVGTTTIGTATILAVTISSLLNAQYLNAAADVYRALIGAVPGSGPVRGVMSLVVSGAEKVYAFRDNAGATACILHQKSGSGWAAVTMFNEVSFTVGGTTAPADGATLTQGANTATIQRVMHQSGSWAANTAAGRFIVTTPTPGNFAAGVATIGAITVTLSGVQTSVTLATGGKVEYEIGNFSGQLSTRRIYGCDGVNRGFEFDGTTFAPIATGASTDSPKHVSIHRNHLFFSIGNSAIHSGPGLPFNYTSTAGASEIAVGDTITGFKGLPGNQTTAALLLACQNTLNIMYGTAASGSNPWNLVPYLQGGGAYDYTVQNIDRTYLLDDRGVIDLQTAQEFGNFLQSTLTQAIQPFIKSKRAILSCSQVSKDRGQYRLFFTDGSGLYCSFASGKFLGCTQVQLANAPYCATIGETAGGDETLYFGSASGGYVYQMEKGSSFDGANIDAYCTLNWNTGQSPRLRKRYRRASLEIQGNFYVAISFGYAFGYLSSEIDQLIPLTYESSFSGGAYWDPAVWDAFVWDGMTLAPTEVEMTGTAENVQITLRSTTDYLYPYTLNSLILHYSIRRALR